MAKLTTKAQVGNTIFGVGVDDKLVIERAQREYGYRQRPSFEAVRIFQSTTALERFQLFGTLQELVTLKGIADALNEHRAGKIVLDDFDDIDAEYKKRKERTWQQARDLLAPHANLDKDIPF